MVSSNFSSYQDQMASECEHVTPGLFRLLISQEVTAADRGGGAFTLSAAL